MVLIIGILAAIALPMYNKAVHKTQIAEALVMLRGIVNGQEAYYLSNGHYTNDLTELDIEVPEELLSATAMGGDRNHDRYVYYCQPEGRCYASRYGNDWPVFQFTMAHPSSPVSAYDANRRVCRAAPTASTQLSRDYCKNSGTPYRGANGAVIDGLWDMR